MELQNLSASLKIEGGMSEQGNSKRLQVLKIPRHIDKSDPPKYLSEE